MQALYDNLDKDEELTLKVHEAVITHARDGFRDMDSSGLRKMKALRRIVEGILNGYEDKKVDNIMQVIVSQKEY